MAMDWRGVEHAQATGDPWLLSRAEQNLAAMYARAGDAEQAIQAAQQAVHAALKTGDLHGTIDTLVFAFGVFHLNQKWSEARDCALKLKNLAGAKYFDSVVALGRLLEARAIGGAGDAGKAAELLSEDLPTALAMLETGKADDRLESQVLPAIGAFLIFLGEDRGASSDAMLAILDPVLFTLGLPFSPPFPDHDGKPQPFAKALLAVYLDAAARQGAWNRLVDRLTRAPGPAGPHLEALLTGPSWWAIGGALIALHRDHGHDAASRAFTAMLDAFGRALSADPPESGAEKRERLATLLVATCARLATQIRSPADLRDLAAPLRSTDFAPDFAKVFEAAALYREQGDDPVALEIVDPDVRRTVEVLLGLDTTAPTGPG